MSSIEIASGVYPVIKSPMPLGFLDVSSAVKPKTYWPDGERDPEFVDIDQEFKNSVPASHYRHFAKLAVKEALAELTEHYAQNSDANAMSWTHAYGLLNDIDSFLASQESKWSIHLPIIPGSEEKFLCAKTEKRVIWGAKTLLGNYLEENVDLSFLNREAARQAEGLEVRRNLGQLAVVYSIQEGLGTNFAIIRPDLSDTTSI